MRTWNTTWCVGPVVLKLFDGVAASERFGNELEAGDFLRLRGVPVPRRIYVSMRFKGIVYARSRGSSLDMYDQGTDVLVAALHNSAKQLLNRAAVPADKPLGWLHRPSGEEDIVSVLHEDLLRLPPAARRSNVVIDLREEIDLLNSIPPAPPAGKILCLTDFSPKNLIVDGASWTLVDLESAIVATPDVFLAKAAVNMARDIRDTSLALHQAAWFWDQVKSRSTGRAVIVWALARMLYFRAVVGGPTKDPTSALRAVHSGCDIYEALEALANA